MSHAPVRDSRAHHDAAVATDASEACRCIRYAPLRTSGRCATRDRCGEDVASASEQLNGIGNGGMWLNAMIAFARL